LIDIVAAHSVKVSIIVATLNSERTLNDCLKSIFELNYPKDCFEVIVVDGCSRDKTVEIARGYPAKVFVEPLNAPAAYNYAIRKARYDIIGFIDADARVEREWLNKLVPYLSDMQVAGVGGGIETWNIENVWSRSIGYDIKNRYERLKDYVKRIATMNLLLKKNVIEEVGGFDETLPTQYDTDLGVRITSKGYKIAFNPNAKCYHYNRSTLWDYFKQQLQYGKNTVKLYFKHSDLIRGDEITDFCMNIQPSLLALGIIFLFLGFPEPLRLFWYLSVALFSAILVYYFALAAKLSLKFKDVTAMVLAVLYFVRAIAWLTGALIMVISHPSKKSRVTKNG